mgnify:FL=1
MLLKLYIINTIIFLIILYISNLFILKHIQKNEFKFFKHYKFIIIIPVVRIIKIIKNINILLNLNDFIYVLYNENNIQDNLTKKQKKLLKNNTKLINFLNINLGEKNIINCLIIYRENGRENIIYYTTINDKIIINSSKGPISKLPSKVQYKKLNQELLKLGIINTTNNNYKNLLINTEDLFQNNNKSDLHLNFSNFN